MIFLMWDFGIDVYCKHVPIEVNLQLYQTTQLLYHNHHTINKICMMTQLSWTIAPTVLYGLIQ